MFKYIFIILLAILTLGSIVYFLVLNPSSDNPPNTQQQSNSQTQDNFPSARINDSNTTSNSSARNDEETILVESIEKNLTSWSQTRKVETLITTLQTTGLPDNEAIIEQWDLFMTNNSGELLKILGNGERKELNENAYIIFEWFIQNSTSYPQLPEAKKQEILRQFYQIQLFLKN